MRLLFLLPLCMVLHSCKTKSSLPVPASFEAGRLPSLLFNDTLLSRADIAAIAGVDAGQLKLYKEQPGTDTSFFTILYSWSSGERKRIMTSDKKQLSIEGYHSIGLGFIRRIDAQAFNRQYESKEAINEQISALTSDENTDPDLAIAEAKYLASQAATRKFEKMEGVAEGVYWETPVQALHLYTSGYAFTITTNCGQGGKDKAMTLARLIFTTLSNQ